MRHDIEWAGVGYAELIIVDVPLTSGSPAAAIADDFDAHDPLAILHTIYVHHPVRGLGYGRRLLQAAIRAAAARDAAVLFLAPVPDDDCPIDVHAWYTRHHFTRTASGMMLTRPLVPNPPS